MKEEELKEEVKKQIEILEQEVKDKEDLLTNLALELEEEEE